MSVELERVGWEDGTLIAPAKVTIGGVTYNITPAEYSGSTPLSAQNLKKMEQNTEDAINSLNKGEYTEDPNNGYNCNYINGLLRVFSVEFTLGTFPAGGDKYDQVYAIPTTAVPNNYTPIAIAGTQLWGGYHSKISFAYIYISGRNIAWAASNNSSNVTGSIGTNVRVLAIKNNA